MAFVELVISEDLFIFLTIEERPRKSLLNKSVTEVGDVWLLRSMPSPFTSSHKATAGMGTNFLKKFVDVSKHGIFPLEIVS